MINLNKINHFKMEHPDIRESIMQINNEVNELRRICNIDNMSRKICSTRSYWQKIFNDEGLQMPLLTYKTPETWLIEYEKELLIRVKLDKLFKVLKNPSPEDFYDGDDIEDKSLYIFETLPFNLLNFNETINSEWNKWLILKSKNLDMGGQFNGDFSGPQIMIVSEQKDYSITFIFTYNNHNFKEYVYTVHEDVIVKIFHLALSCGVDIFNSSNNTVRY